MAKSLFGNGSVQVIVHPEGIQGLLNSNKAIRDLLVGVGKDVSTEAAATASAAEKGPGGTIDGYAAAGFTVEYQARGGKRPRVIVKSNADGRTAFKAHMATQMRNGVGHLRAALYKFTKRG